MAEKEQTKGESSPVRRWFWVGATVFVLVSVVVGGIVGVFAAGGTVSPDTCVDPPSPTCPMDMARLAMRIAAGALVGLGGGVLAFILVNYKFKARLAAEQEPDAE